MNVRLATSAVVAAAGAVLLAVTPSATAAAPTVASPAPVKHAPNFEAEFPVAVKGAEVTFGGQDLTTDLTGKATLDIAAPSPGNLEAKASGTLEVTADHPDLGKITLKSEAKGSASFNSVLSPFPAKLDLSADATMTVEKAPGNGKAAQPLELKTKDPASLAGNLDQFPPKGNILDLQNPVDLVDQDDKTVATVNKFPLTVA